MANKSISTKRDSSAKAKLVTPIVESKIRTVGVKFRNSDTIYSYLTDDLTIEVGDYVIVDGAGGYTVVEVHAVGETSESIIKANKYIVDKINVTKYRNRVETNKKLEVLRIKLKKGLEEAQQQMQLDLIAKQYPQLAALTAEIKALEGK